MATVNLVPSTQYLAAARARRSFLLLCAAGILFVLLLVWGGLTLWGTMLDKQIDDVQGRTSALQTKLAEAQPVATRITLFEKRLGVLDALLKKHTAVDPLFVEIEKRMPATSSLSNLIVNVQQGTVTFEGAAPSPDEVGQIVASLASSVTHLSLFEHVQLRSIELKEVVQDGKVLSSNYIFLMNGTFNPTALQIIKATN